MSVDKQPTGAQLQTITNNRIRCRPASMGSTFQYAKGRYGVMSASIPITDMVINETRKLILSGHDVNFNIMLIPNYVKTKFWDIYKEYHQRINLEYCLNR